MGHKKTNLNICHHMLTSSTYLQNWSFHVVERTRTSSKCQKLKNARAKRAKILFFIVKYASLWSFCCRRRRGCLSSLIIHRRAEMWNFSSSVQLDVRSERERYRVEHEKRIEFHISEQPCIILVII